MSIRKYILAAIAVALLQTAALGSMVWSRAQIIKNGTEVVIRSQMRDPRDLFRGHYTRLNLDVGDIPVDRLQTDNKLDYGDPVYIELEKGEGTFWVAKRAYEKLPENPQGPVVKGKITFLPRNGDPMRVNFPFDRYFANRDRALELEKIQMDEKQELGVILSLDGSGNGAIKGITINGDLLYEEPLY